MGLFKKKPPTPEQIAAEEAKSFFDCICPSTVKFFPHHYIVGDSYRCVWAIKEYPPPAPRNRQSFLIWQTTAV